jgi:hypothetical protein
MGQHKTGSKYLQAFLTANSARLAVRGIVYPTGTGCRAVSAYRNSHFHLYALLRIGMQAGCGGDPGFREAHQRYCGDCADLPSLLRVLERERIAQGARTIVLSAEDLFDMHTAHEADFDAERVARAARVLSTQLARLGWETTFVVYLRRPAALLEAHYAQYIKGWIGNTLDFDTFFETFAPRLRALGILRAWSSAFPGARWVVRPYEGAGSGFDIVRDFMQHALACPVDGSWAPVAEDLELFNTTPDLRYIELLRRMNARSTVLAHVFTHRDVLELAFRKRGRKRRLSYLSRERGQALERDLEGEFEELAREFASSPSFFREPLNGRAALPPLPEPRLRSLDLWGIGLQLSAQRLGKGLAPWKARVTGCAKRVKGLLEEGRRRLRPQRARTTG